MSVPVHTRDFVRICLLAGVIAALGLLPKFVLPFTAGVPITAQTLGVMLAGVVLGGRNGALAVALFLFVVALGLPFLAGGRGGLGVFFGPTGGFLIGWIAGAWVVGTLMQMRWIESRFARALVASLLGGVVIIYAFGAPWLAFVAGMRIEAAALASLAFLPGDILKALAAAAVASALPPDQTA